MRVSLNHIRILENTGVRKANRAVIAIYGSVNFETHRRYMRFTHQAEHREQEKGFGTLAFPFNHFDSTVSILSIIPLRSIINTHNSVISNRFIIISNSLSLSLSYPNNYVTVYDYILIGWPPFFQICIPYIDRR